MANLTEAQALELIGRLSRTEKFPEDDDGIRQLGRTLMEAAPDRAMAERVVERVRRTCKFCPADAEFFLAADELGRSADLRPWDPNQKCPAGGGCGGYGWVVVERDGVSAAEPCVCRNAKEAAGR